MKKLRQSIDEKLGYDEIEIIPYSEKMTLDCLKR